MSVLPAPVALTLLFQFTWVGLVIQAIATRRAPHACHIIAAGVIMAGTIFASGLYGTDLGSLDPVGALEWAGVATVLAGVVIAQLPSFASRGAQRSRAYPPNAPILSGTKSK